MGHTLQPHILCGSKVQAQIAQQIQGGSRCSGGKGGCLVLFTVDRSAGPESRPREGQSSRVLALRSRITRNSLLALAEPLRTPQLVGSSQVSAPDSITAAIAVRAGAMQGVASALGAVQRCVVFVPAHSTREAGVVVALKALQGDHVSPLHGHLCQVLNAVPDTVLEVRTACQ